MQKTTKTKTVRKKSSVKNKKPATKVIASRPAWKSKKTVLIAAALAVGAFGLYLLASTYAASTNRTFTVGAYNVLNAERFQRKSNATGGCWSGGSDPRCIDKRSTRQANIILGRVGGAKMDIVGTQETSPKQLASLKKKLGRYNVHPSNGDMLNSKNNGFTAIWWDTRKFKLVEHGRMAGLSNIGRRVMMPWVALKMNDGPKVYVLSVHQALPSKGGSSAYKHRAASMLTKWATNKSAGKHPVFLVGDYNEKPTKSRITHCAYHSKGIKNAYDSVRGAGLRGGCGKTSNGFIDHVYYTQFRGVYATNWKRLSMNSNLPADQRQYVDKASDHPPVIATFRVK